MYRRTPRDAASMPVLALGAMACLWIAGASLIAAARAEPAASASPNDVAKSADADEIDDLERNGSLDRRIREAAQRDQIPDAIIEELIRIFSNDVDFERAAHPGDGFIVYPVGAGERTRSGDAGILFASLTYNGQTKRFYRFALPDGDVGYYDENGRSARKLLLRRPVNGAMLRSGFGVHRNPVLGISKLHSGVDWMAPIGTPIYAAGLGAVETAGWEGEYGKIVRLRHPNGYTTAYAHMSAIARGISPGVEVRQGSLIGHVGATGISSGPHLHYEVLVNGRFVDPMRIRLPAQHVLDGPALDDFQRERARLDEAAGHDAVFHALFAQ